MAILDVMRARRSIRAYETRPIEPEKLDAVFAAIGAAPSAGNYQSFGAVVVTGPGDRARLMEACFGQPFLGQAPVSLVFLTDPAAAAEKYGPRAETLFAVQDATIACTHAMLAAADLGLGSVWVGAFDPEKVAAVVGAAPPMQPVAVLPLGYPAEAPAPTSRKPLDQVIRPNRW